MNKRLLYVIFICIILGGVIFLWRFIHNTHESRFGYIVNSEREIIDITPVHTGYNIKIINQKGPQFDNEEDCEKRADEESDRDRGGIRVCYTTDPDDWIGFYMGDSEPRPVFKTYEECEDWAISMRPYSFIKNAKGGVHVVEDGVTRCSQGCNYHYVWHNRKIWEYSCNKTIYSTRDHFDYFEKVFDKLEEGWNYERFENAFKSRAGCDIKVNTDNEAVYSYLVGIRFSYDLDEYRANVEKMTLKQKIKKDGKIFYVEQLEGLVYVRGDIFDEGIGKVYKIKDGDKKIIFSNTKELLEDKNVEMDCHGDFNMSPNMRKELYSLPEDIKWVDGGTIDNIYHRLYED